MTDTTDLKPYISALKNRGAKHEQDLLCFASNNNFYTSRMLQRIQTGDFKRGDES